MFYTNKSIRLHSKALDYLELIQQANRRYEEKMSTLARYDACKDIYAPIKLMNDRPIIVKFMNRYQNLSTWLVNRYQKVFTELGTENLRQMKKEIDRMSENELQHN